MSGQAFGQAGEVVSVYNGGVVSNSREVVLITDSRQVSGRSIVHMKDFNMAAPGGRTAPATMRWAIGESMVIRNGIAVARAAFGPLSAGLAIAALIYESRMKPNTAPAGEGVPDVFHDEGTAPTPQGARCVQVTTGANGRVVNNGGGYGQTCDTTYTGLAATFNARLVSAGGYCSGSSCGEYRGNATQLILYSCFNGTTTCTNGSSTNIPTVAGTVNSCPAFVDWNDPAYSKPAGPPGPDGMCPTGTYTRGMNADEAADWVRNHGRADDVDLGKMWDEVLGRSGPSGVPIPKTNDWQADVTPPPSLQGPTTTTTHPDGRVTETATGWDFSKVPSTPGGTTGTDVKVTPKTTTTEKNSSGGVVSTSTTTSTGPSTDPNDPCQADPGRLGCIGLGAAPADKVPTLTKSISYEAENLGMGAAQCPPPIPIGNGREISFQPACDAATTIKPLVLAGAAFSAMMMIVFALRAG